MGKRILSLSVAIFLIFAAIAYYTPTANAESYPNTYKNTGKMRKDLIGVALTQVGYREGKNNDTKYGDWYGLPNKAWCGMFVSWCANQADIPTTVLRKTGAANPGSFGLTSLSGGKYRPQPGDLFFSKSNGHVGIVYKVYDTTFTSIEGNTWRGNSGEGVYIIEGKKIASYNFGSPNYNDNTNHDYEKGTESAHPHKVYYKCSICGDKYYTGKTATVSDCLECKQASCSHSYGEWKRISDSKHERTCTKCQYKQTKNHSWNSGTVDVPATCKAAGSKTQTCKDCGTTKKVTIAKLTTHDYSEWLLQDDNYHVKQCAVCGKKQTERHEVEDMWSTDENEHWHDCTVCLSKVKLTEHKFGESCDSPCLTCGYTPLMGHSYEETWLTDNVAHWYKCDDCGDTISYDVHTYDNDCDPDCNICGFKRNASHKVPKTMSTDIYGHWYECSVCGEKLDAEGHKPGEEATEQFAQVCLVCNYEIEPALPHEHHYTTVSYDNENHWGTCSCGEEMELQPHVWNMGTQSCEVCGMDIDSVNSFDWSILPWAGAGLLVSGGIIGSLILAFRKRR